MKNCCLLSKSWIPRARGHLFKTVRFYSRRDLGSWKKTFPDRSTSPACYTTNLAICPTERVTAADTEGGGWIRAFSQVVDLYLGIGDKTSFLIPFHGLSHALKFLRVDYGYRFPFSRVLNLIRSFPLINDLSVIASDCPLFCYSGGDNGDNDSLDGEQVTFQPPFTGFLMLHMLVGVDLVGL